MAPFQTINFIHMQQTNMIKKDMAVSTELPLTICINNDLFDQIMRTPGDEKAQVIGLMFCSRIISAFDEIQSVTLTTSKHGDTVDVQIQKKQSCLSTIKQENNQWQGKKLSLADIQGCFTALSSHQPIREMTRSTHAAVLFDCSCQAISAKEDIGRHNALDKVIGQSLIDDTLEKARILVLSSRVSHELITKVIQTPVQCIFSVSRPSSLAIEIAREYNISMACLSKNDGVFIFSGFERFEGSDH